MKKTIFSMIWVCAVLSCASLPALTDFNLKPVYATDFSKPEKWETFDTATKNYKFAEGHYAISYKTDNWCTYIPYWDKVSVPYSFTATASLVLADPSKDGNVTLVCNYTDAKNYDRLRFNDAGEYSITIIKDGQPTEIQNWKKSKLIKGQGEKNTFQVFQTADTCLIFVNGMFLTKFQSVPVDGKVEVGIGTGCGTGENLTLATTRYYSFSLSAIAKE